VGYRMTSRWRMCWRMKRESKKNVVGRRCCGDSGGETQESQPNVVLVLADDMGWGDLGCYGATKIPTPAMDRIAAQGLRATDCHSASAVCTPSRYALLTGRYAWRGPLKQRVLVGHSPAIIEPDRPTIATVLRDAGYATGAFGKWHLGLGWRFRDGRSWSAFDPGAPLWPEVDDGSNIDYAAGFEDGPISRGFDRFFGIAGSLNMPPYCFLNQDSTVGVPSIPKQILYPRQRRGLQVDDWRDDEVDCRFVEEACSWIETQVLLKRPFFCYLATSAPHRPCVPPGLVRGASSAGQRGDMVCLVDWAVGRVDEILKQCGIQENTIIVVSSDNGAELTYIDNETYGHRANGNWRGQKADIWEGGHREPFIARWPGRIAPNSVVSGLFGLIDLLPTLAVACGADLPDGAAEDGRDVLDLFIGKGPSSDDVTIVHHSASGMFAVRRGSWKVIMGEGSGGFSPPRGNPCDSEQRHGQLYNLAEDAEESYDQWAQRPEVVADLYDELKRIATAQESGLSFDVPIRSEKFS